MSKFESRLPSTAKDWQHLIENAINDRCDLDVLLKDEWRHKVAVRDGSCVAGSIKEQLLVMDSQSYASFKELLRNNHMSLGAFVLTAFHSVLDSYGHGSRTVVAFVDAVGKRSLKDGKVLPTIVDHTQQLDGTCIAAVETIERSLRHEESYMNPTALLQLGLFDAVLVLADNDGPMEDMLPLPLAAAIRDDEAEGRLLWKMSYAGDLFEDRVVAGVLDVVRALLVEFFHRPTQLIGDLEIVSEAQRRQLDAWNATDGEFPAEKRLEELFEDAVRRTPDREALIFRDIRLTYCALNKRCNRLAHWLLGPKARVRPEELIALYLDKSELSVVATIGIWKAGAACVPIEPSYPADRVRITVRDTRVTRIVANRHHAARLRGILAEQPAVQIIELETVLEAAATLPTENPKLNLGSTRQAYVMYTSGTTGIPKGVAKEHRSVVNSITDLSERYRMRGQPGEESVALFATYVFEPFMRQTLLALINSHILVIVPDEIRLDPYRFPVFVARHDVTYLNGTGSVLQHFDLRTCPSLRKLVLVGEELTAVSLRQLREKFDGHIIIEYSFTESAFVTAIKEFTPSVVERTDRSIGRPLRNVKWYVLSDNLKLVPIGAIGELYIGGCGLARGYLNRDDLTAERFLANPFQTEQEKLRGENGVIYKTGDLARMLPNGEIEYMGRRDFQLKLNGIRIEPGEIEARATEFPGVRKCVVVAREGPGGTTDRHLVGYFVAEPTSDVAEADLLAFLEEQLIRVMVPARMVRLPSIPVNVNGKVDWRALPYVSPYGSAATGSAADGATRPVDPANGIIDTLREIWSDVLGVPAASIHPRDDFFRLGGQSISCILLIARVRQHLRLAVSVEDVFTLRTLGNLAEHLGRQPTEKPEPKMEPAAADVPEDGGPVKLLANGLQQGLMYNALKSETGDDAYVMQSVYRYRCPIRPDLMEQAWRHAQAKYPSLRLRFEWCEEALQIIDADEKPLDWRFIDLCGVTDTKTQEAHIDDLQRRDRAEPYALDAGRLFRVYLIKQRDDLFALLFSCHHIILDGWSLPIMHDDVHRTYLRLIRGITAEPVTDTAYVAAQRYWEAHRGDHVDYWTKELERISERGDFTGLLNERSRYKIALRNYDQVREHRTRKLGTGAGLTSVLRAACTAHQLTLHSVLQFVWHKVLYAIGGGRTTVVGTIVSGRNLPIEGIEDSVGLFINTLPIIVDHDEQATKSVAAAVADIQAATNSMNSRSTVELGRLESGEMKRQLFDTLLVLENYPRLLDEAEACQHSEQLRFEKAYDVDKVDHPLAIVAREEGGELVVNLWYAGELFDDDAIDTLLDTAQTLFVQVAESMSQPVGNLEFVSDGVLAQFDAWNDTKAEFPKDKTLHRVFEEAADRWPNEVAVIFRTTQLTYRTLNERANRLAHYLLSVVPLQPDDLIGLVIDKSEKMIIAILAVWKAGAGYVPIDPNYPDDRVAFMLEDTQARLLITNEMYGARLRQLLNHEQRHVLDIEQLYLDGQPSQNPVTSTSSNDLAYAIYTSGTTGKPKAVLIEHRGVVNLHASLAKLFSLSRADAVEALLSFSNYVFDHFVEQMTDALLNGQTLVVLDDGLRTDNPRLYKYMNDHRVTYLSGTPSVLSLYDFSSVTSLTRIDAIGEDFTEPVFNTIRKAFNDTIINGYGPTEISITSHKRLYSEGEPRVNKSIGFPVTNTTCYVLNGAMKRVPVGGIGELFIGGSGVARGYLNRDDLTAERFLRNPFQTPGEKQLGTNARIYKTGDLVRWLPNGELEYLGRNDLQVKIRGQRVELGEIEAVLSSYPGVSRSFVIAREHRIKVEPATPQKYIVGFYLSERNLAEQDLMQWMRSKLPHAVVPVRILRIDKVPVTASGKLDVRRLPETDFVAEGGVDYFAPSTEIEIELCGIWSKVLDIAPGRIGVRDDFFALGGDSLRAIKLSQSVTNGFGRILDVAALFKHTTIESQAQHINKIAAAQESKGVSTVGLGASHAGDPPVSLAQERLLFIDEFVGGTAAYNIPFVVEMATSAVSRDAITSALRTLVRRHPALRTVLLRGERDGVRLQCVLGEHEALAKFEVAEHTANSRGELDTMLVDEAGHVFRLDADLPIRAGLFELAGVSGKVYVSVVVHHSCFDGWSWDVFRRELAALASGVSEAEFAGPRASYSDFAVWQRRRLTGDQLSTLTYFWAKALAGFEPLNLPLDRPRPPQFDYRGREALFDLSAETAGQLKALAKTARVSFYSVLLGAYCLMLKTYTGQHDIVVGTPSANRGRPEFDDVIGLFANLLVMRARVDGASVLLNYLRSVGEAVVQAQVHQELPFEKLVKLLRVEKDPSRHPVVQAVFSLLNDDASDEEAFGVTGRLSMNKYVPNSDGWTTAKFDLSLTVTESATGLAGNFTYAASLLDSENVSNLVSSFKHILKEFARLHSATETATVLDVRCLDEGARAAVLAAAVGFTPQPPSRGGRGQTLHEVFEDEVARWPRKVAVVYGSTELTYSELNERANQLAHYLLSAADLHPNDLVALVMDKSERMVVAILAVWKAGAAYVPVDPSYTDDRVTFMLDDTRARLVVADEAHGARLRQLPNHEQRHVLDVEQLRLNGQPSQNPVTSTSSTDLAYAIYTSGTTGKPKAVLIEHRNVVSFRNDLTARYFGDTAGPRQAVLFLANYVFDFSIEQLMLSILSGHKLIVPPMLPIHDDEFYDYVNRHELTYLSGTPTYVQQFDLSRLKHLQLVLVAGEAFQAHHFNKIRREYSGPLLNAYGTTETTVYNTVRRFEPDEAYRNALGEPLSNTRLYVLGSDLQLLPMGAVGELFIAGDCVSTGYLNQSELTRERFVPNPFQTEDERREGQCAVIYKTGDVVRWRADGDLEFLGRNDSQVKINGLRVELGEVEAAIASYPGVRQCAVVPRDDTRSLDSKHLVGYYVVDGTTTVAEDDVVAFLRAKLMPAMVPAMLIRIDGSLPITINGKLDTDALPCVDFSAERVVYAAPRSRLESRLCQMWSNLLPGSAVGVDDDFFRCGGDSIIALQLASELQRELNRKVSVKLIFDYPTVRSFVENALGGTPKERSRGEQGPLTGGCPMLPIQEWFFAKPLASRSHWNQYFAIRTPPLEFDKLREAFDRVFDHHDAFRLRFRSPDGNDARQVEQFYSDGHPRVTLQALNVQGLRVEEVQRQLEEWQSKFDLERGPLHCAAYLHGFDDGFTRVWVAMHHLIVDTVSWRVLMQDLEILYNGGNLGPRGSSYRQWAQALRSYDPAPGETQLWAEVARGVTAGANETISMTVNPAQSYRDRFALSERETQTLLVGSNRAYDTQINDLLLTAIGFALPEVTQQAINYVTVEGHGREAFDDAPDVRDTVGWFTTMHPVAVEVCEDLGRSIKLTKASRRCVPYNGIGYGAIRGVYGGAQAPIPTTSFNYLGRFDGGAAVERTLAPRESAGWRLDAPLCGTSRATSDAGTSDCAVDVTMRCVGSRMVVEVHSQLGKADTRRFTAVLKSRLEEIIAHTSTVAFEMHGGPQRTAAHASRNSDDFDPYILVNENEAGPVLFILPPGEGGAESYLNNIAKQLPGIRLVLFNNVHLQRPMHSFEALARHYITHVRQLQPSGPYSLLGWSFGGVLSFEMALQLTRTEENVANLILIDSFFNVSKASTGIGLREVETVFDPINDCYAPKESDLKRLRARTSNVLLFKATKPDEKFEGENQRRFFEYYARSAYNNLETLIPRASFAVELLPDDTHFSWVLNEPLVASMSSRIRQLVQGPR